jgi:hypothetical protein
MGTHGGQLSSQPGRPSGASEPGARALRSGRHLAPRFLAIALRESTGRHADRHSESATCRDPPASLMNALPQDQPEPGGIREFMSTMGPPFSQRKGWLCAPSTSQGMNCRRPGLRIAAERAADVAIQAPGLVAWPFFQSVARSVSLSGVVALPRPVRNRRSNLRTRKSPPSVPRSTLSHSRPTERAG